MSDEQQDPPSDFFEAMKDVRPIKADDKVLGQKPKHTLAQQLKRQALEKASSGTVNYLSVEKVTPLDPYDVLEFKKDGVQEGVYKNLRLGKYQIDTVINLQQRKFEQARELMFDSIVENHRRGVRSLLIQHGLGLHSKPFPAFLKSYVNQWLREMPEVLAFHSAMKHQGGLGSVYVLLKKNNQQKLENKELHRRKQS